MPLGLLENRRRQRPGRSFERLGFFSRARNHEKSSARRQCRFQRREGLWQEIGRERLQGVAFMDEIESLMPRIRQREEIALHIGDLRFGKPLLCPCDRLAHEIERRDMRTSGCKTFGIVAEAAADIENA